MADKRRIVAQLDGIAEAFNAHDIDRIMSYFAVDCSLGMPRGPAPHAAAMSDWTAPGAVC